MTKPPGIEDIFPDKIPAWNHLMNSARDVFRIYNYREIVIPVMEFTDVFARGLGDETDIVSKEMFTFEDRGGRSLTLRPEGTASVVRAYVENGEYNRLSAVKLFYAGPMFRAEKPQRGRLRQFNQIGAEFFGSADPYYDFEIVAAADSIAKKTGISGYSILINTIGCPVCRKEFLAELKKYYTGISDRLCEDCQKRLNKNPMRLLDCKNEQCAPHKKNAPVISQMVCPPCAEHHSVFKGHLDSAGIVYKEEPMLVRGLDYYTRTTFEFITDKLGAQNTFAAGGRYDNLVEVFGGKPTPAVGFALGVERMLLLLEEAHIPPAPLDAYMVHTGGASLAMAMNTMGLLREAGISADIDPETKGFKAQFKKADREGALFSIITGEDETSSGEHTVKNMKTGEQIKVKPDKLAEYIFNNSK